MNREEIERELERLRLRLKDAEFNYSVSTWSSGPSWREHISKLKAEIFDLERALEATNA